MEEVKELRREIKKLKQDICDLKFHPQGRSYLTCDEKIEKLKDVLLKKDELITYTVSKDYKHNMGNIEIVFLKHKIKIVPFMYDSEEKVPTVNTFLVTYEFYDGYSWETYLEQYDEETQEIMNIVSELKNDIGYNVNKGNNE